MKTFYPNTTLTRELNFKVGDIITCYFKGFWKVVKIEPRWYDERDVTGYATLRERGEEYSPLVVVTQVADGNGKPKKSKEVSCDSAYCCLATISIDRQILELETKKGLLEMFKSTI